MGKVIAFLKSYGLIVASTVVLFVAPAAGLFFGMSMNASLKEERGDEAQNEMRRVDGSRVSYSVPGIGADDEGVELSAAPNSVLTEWFAARRKEVAAEVERASSEIIQFNRREHGVLVEGLLPEPTDDRAGRLLMFELIDRLIGADGEPTAYDALFRRIRAGSPANAEQVAAKLNEARDEFVERLIADRGPGELDEDESAELAAHLSGVRLDEYRGRAGAISVYAEDMALGLNQTPPLRPTSRPATPPGTDVAFGWMFDYWVLSDVFEAIALANTSDVGTPTPVTRSVVKRINAVTLAPFEVSGGDDRGATGRRGRGSFGGGESAGAATLTGRSGSDPSGLYDLRTVQLDLVVDASRIDALIKAFERTNLMTIVEMDVSSVDAWAELAQGYFWGDSHVVRVSMSVETLWLRTWTAEFMPDSIADALGVVRPSSDEDDA
ncbi:MAG: hypothetical protein AAGB51_08315 [Planctomycetota bacterium]